MSTAIYRGSMECPSYFVRHCRDAQAARQSYDEAGYALAGDLVRLAPDDQDQAFWSARLDELAAALRPIDGAGRMLDPDDDAVWAWFRRNLPRCMTLVPRVRKRTFLRGVYRYAIEEDNDVTVD